MAKYVYPAIFTEEENGMYSVAFPDISGCFTCGSDLCDAIEMAEDAEALMLYHFEQEKRDIPIPSKIEQLELHENEFVNLIACDTIEYQRMNNNKSVKKTLSIPEWLNEAATSAGLNFSKVLQDGLKTALGL